MKKVMIAVPTFENITPDTFKSIYDLDKAGCECIFEFQRGYDCATARNNIAQGALNLGVDYVFMVDNDIVLPQDALVKLMEGEPDIVLGHCPARNSANIYDGKTAIYRLGEFNFTDQITVAEMKNLENNSVSRFHVHGGGMAIALIKTEHFKKLPYPWFDWVNYENKGVLSEDLYFCEKCNNAGIQINVDPRVGCGHLMRHVQWGI